MLYVVYSTLDTGNTEVGTRNMMPASSLQSSGRNKALIKLLFVKE